MVTGEAEGVMPLSIRSSTALKESVAEVLGRQHTQHRDTHFCQESPSVLGTPKYPPNFEYLLPLWWNSAADHGRDLHQLDTSTKKGTI